MSTFAHETRYRIYSIYNICPVLSSTCTIRIRFWFCGSRIVYTPYTVVCLSGFCSFIHSFIHAFLPLLGFNVSGGSVSATFTSRNNVIRWHARRISIALSENVCDAKVKPAVCLMYYVLASCICARTQSSLCMCVCGHTQTSHILAIVAGWLAPQYERANECAQVVRNGHILFMSSILKEPTYANTHTQTHKHISTPQMPWCGIFTI